jgi:hypothetical protein
MEFEDTISGIFLSHIGLPPRLFETIEHEDLYREVKRSRRFQNPLAVVAIEADFEPGDVELNQLLKDFQKSMASRFVQVRIAKLLSEELRDVDLIAQHNDGFVVLMPMTTLDEARRTSGVLEAAAKTSLGISLKTGVGTFPDTALTLGGLLEVAQDDLASGNKTSPGTQPSLAGSGD